MFAGAGNELVRSPSEWILVKGNRKNKTASTKTSPVSHTKQAAKKPVWIEKLSVKNVPHLRVKKMTWIKDCGTKATTRKANDTESISLPTRFSKKPVSASTANLANGKLSVLNVNRSVPRKPARSSRAGKPFEGLDQIYTKIPK